MGDGVETPPGKIEDGDGRQDEGQEDPGPPDLDVPAEPEEVEAPQGPPEPEEDGLATAIAGLDARLEESQRLLARQSELIDRLHTENQELRAGELRNAQLPLVRDLLRMHDDLGRMRDAGGEANGDLRVLHESLLDTLARNGIERFAPEPGEPFDSRFHSAAGVEPTEDQTLDKAVAEVTRHGFRWDSGSTIRVAEVRAYRYRDSG